MLLEVRNINHIFTYNTFFKKYTKQILNNVSFKMKQRENIALIGPSGCGKSTLAKIIAQLQKPQSGQILFNGKVVNLENLQQKKEFYKQAQILFQDPLSSLNPRYNVLEHLQEPLNHLLNIQSKSAQLQKIYPILEQLDLPNSILYHYPAMLSGGQAQRVCIARMLLIKPLFVILDETTSGLDYELQEEIWNLFLNMQKIYNTTFLFITHDLILARKYCQRIILMEEGKIIEDLNTNDEFKSNLGKEFDACFHAVL
ncbi:dipeptide/oligopeptide/nickel ABC transporter ATP-binding protein [Helicobacter bilis]|uniref:ABC transporter ATP-binding protein n=1 Tax=Helicobacter bilis TaxID=37372 RepID=A0A4U8UCV5_9HELI|nr:dipeptide/oligopeptide/nickel ABC transporter ATP-binding protein [Helicobacter bilis]MCI7410478.1 dipeptide/oligopeptide/nickel ABC transporter ATP-binding protein [Helicobacter bilis]MDD7297211.1 dipeptide/oligopeptide/nickel ABC transporter ATP-binding protein [Helicobacter bilis]MDY4400960.1 dipeptide/oligopeptide/nickel ABC transporter ATP-binding protein [Helicobacter bilis]TLE12253.1 ABC transporter ATP-binding protein [Helicobacter bilis]